MKKVISFEQVKESELNRSSSMQDRESFYLLVNGEKQSVTGHYLCGTEYKFDVKVSKYEKNAALRILKNDGDEYPFRIKKFTYNGFFGKEYKTFIKEKGRFLRWSGDPGIAVMLLDNGKELLTPTYAIPGSCLIPRDDSFAKGTAIIFGTASAAK